MSDKKYVGTGRQAPNGLEIVNISISESKVKDFWTEYNGERYLRLGVSKKREADQYGKTHSVYIDEWQPSSNNNQSKAEPVKVADDDFAF
jgi:hypothetical protein|tara:strand:+ start:14 stop:283 length:270 start_codon:yes stop_codon:yes gene_type:complete